MFEKNEVLDDKAAEVFQAVAHLNRDDVISYALIARITGYEIDSGRWLGVCRRLRLRILRERKIATYAIDNTGFKLCTVKEQLNLLAERRQKKARRQLGRTVLEVGCLPASELSLHEKRVKAFRVEQVKTMWRLLKRSARQQREAARKSESLPKTQRMPELVAE